MPPKQTTELLRQLRNIMADTKYVSEPLQAYIIPTNDEHSSEYVAECDKFRAYITGFTGSAGTAVVTNHEACLWTDGRYFPQVHQQTDPANWVIMQEGLPSTPTLAAWLCRQLPVGSTVGVDPKLFTTDMWNNLNNPLQSSGHKLIPVMKNLIGIMWIDRPNRPANPIEPLPIKYTGKIVEEKLKLVIHQMEQRGCSTLVISALDDIAWTLNLRGSDIDYNPLFFSYLVIHPTHIALFVNLKQVNLKVHKHLTEEIGAFTFSINPYEEIEQYIKNCQNQKVWFPPNVNYFLTSLVLKQNQHIEISPVTLMKAVKNEAEVEGMRNAHIKDAVALCCYFAWLEQTVPTGVVTEISGAAKLEWFRSLQEDFVGLSFPTISSSGSNAAIIHYQPSEETDRLITTDSIYLCDSGAQFRDGTTDVTRTVHFGTPTEYEKEMFTRVLKGQLKLERAVFPSKIKGNYLDSFAREFLWEVGLDYGHGTSHGIGSYLNVHEGPMGISWRPYPEDPGLESNMFLSNEPGFYQDGNFGIRLEDIVQIVPANTPHNHNNRGFLTFETITFCPKQTKMIKVEMLTDKEIDNLNEYHQKCRSIVGPILEEQGRVKVKEWLWRETEPIKRI